MQLLLDVGNHSEMGAYIIINLPKLLMFTAAVELIADNSPCDSNGFLRVLLTVTEGRILTALIIARPVNVGDSQNLWSELYSIQLLLILRKHLVIG